MIIVILTGTSVEKLSAEFVNQALTNAYNDAKNKKMLRSLFGFFLKNREMVIDTAREIFFGSQTATIPFEAFQAVVLRLLVAEMVSGKELPISSDERAYVMSWVDRDWLKWFVEANNKQILDEISQATSLGMIPLASMIKGHLQTYRPELVERADLI